MRENFGTKREQMDLGPWFGDKNMFFGGYGLIQFSQSSQRDNLTFGGMGGKI